MSTLSIRFPKSIYSQLKTLASEEGISINQLVNSAVIEKVSALKTESFLQDKAQQADKDAFLRILASVPDLPADSHDTI
jgi:hypothetical protein